MLDNTPPTSPSVDTCTLPVETRFSAIRTEYEWRDVTIDFATGARLSCRVPVKWSDNAASTLMGRYAVRAGVSDDKGGRDGREVDAERIFDRLVAGWKQAAIEHGYWHARDSHLARFCAEVKAMLEQQVAAPNSPQWFNTGVAVQYGIEAGSDGHYYATIEPNGQVRARACSDSLAQPQISACFIQSVEDKLVGAGGIMDLWEREARLFKYGSGSGVNYSALRGKGEPLSRGGVSSGLLSFLRVGDRSAGAIKSGGTTRRSARMVVVDDDHPDVESFVQWKVGEGAKIRALHAAGFGDPSSFEDEATETMSGQNANNSVAVSDDFMRRAANADEEWELRARTDGRVVKTVSAPGLWAQIANAAWQCADPGLQFSDTINEWHTCKADGPIRGSNPCGEYVFLDDTACNLASLNLAKFYAPSATAEHCFDWEGYAHAARLWTIVLDISVSMAGYPTAEIARRSMLYRTLGLGYAALGELLVLLGLGYGTQAGRDLAAELTSLLTATAYLTSTELAAQCGYECGACRGQKGSFESMGHTDRWEKCHACKGFGRRGVLGPFPRYEANAPHVLDVLGKHRDAAPPRTRSLWLRVIEQAQQHGVRNAQVTLLAPCGTIGIVMDCETTGVEPYYADTTFKSLSGGGTMRIVSERFAQALREGGHDPAEYTRNCWTVERGEVLEYTWVEPPSELENVLVVASTLTPEQHVDMMAAVQPHLSGAISKTINMAATATSEAVADTYRYAWEEGLKSISIYRDGCKPAQPLQSRLPACGIKTFPDQATAEMFAAAARGNGRFFATLRDDVEPSLEKYTDAVAERAGDAVKFERMALKGPKQLSNVAFTYRGAPIDTSLARGTRADPPAAAAAVKHRVELSGHTFYLFLTEHLDGSLAEVFVTCSRTGSAVSGWVNAWAKMFSLALQHGAPLDALTAAMRGETFDPSGYHEGHPTTSAVDCFARIIEDRYLSDSMDRPTADLVGRTQAPVISVQVHRYAVRDNAFVDSPPEPASADSSNRPTRSTGQFCTRCGSTDLRRAGACHVCGKCGETTGCS